MYLTRWGRPAPGDTDPQRAGNHWPAV